MAATTPAGAATRDVARNALFPALAMTGVIIAWGLGPPISKLITAPPLVTVGYRLTLSLPVLYLMLRINGGGLSVALLRRCVIPGVFFGANLAIVFAAFQEATIVVISVLNAMQPAVVLLAARPLFGERPGGWHLAWTAVGFGGTVAVILGAGDEVRTSTAGLVLSTLAMLTFTAYFLATKRVRAGLADVGAIEWMLGVSIFAVATVVPIALATSDRAELLAVAGTDWVWMAWAVLGTGIAGHVLMSWVHRYIPVSRSSLYLLAMNVVAISAAWPIHDEPVTVVQALGGLVVLGAVAAVGRRQLAPPAT